MSQGYKIEPLTNELLPLLVPLMEDVFGGNPRTALFDWKYRNNPAGPAIGHAARSASGELVAFYGMIPEIYRWGTINRRIYQSCDTMTHSRHRRKGLFQLLAKATYVAAAEADPGFFAIGFSGPMSTPGFLKMGWTAPFDIPHRFKPRLLAQLGALGGRGPIASDEMPAELPYLMRKREGKRTNSKSFYPEFVSWRLSSPSVRYSYLIDDGAYAVFKRSPGFVYLLDCWEDGPGAGKQVMAELNREASSRDSRGLLTACQLGSDCDLMLRRYAFFRNPFERGPASERTPFIVFGAPPVPEATSAAGWELTSIDFDSL